MIRIMSAAGADDASMACLPRSAAATLSCVAMVPDRWRAAAAAGTASGPDSGPSRPPSPGAAATAGNSSRQRQQQPAAPPQPRATAGASGRAAQLIYSPWVKLCNKDADPKAKRVCVTVKDGRVESGLLVVSVAIIEMDGEQRKLLRMSLPYGVALAARHAR